jgi:hypothetical protein
MTHEHMSYLLHCLVEIFILKVLMIGEMRTIIYILNVPPNKILLEPGLECVP